MSTKIGVFYEPGAGGDFFITLLSLGLNIFEEPEILYFDDGRIKVRGKSMLDVVDDYEYTDDDCSLEELFLKQNFDRYISKCHPYLPEQKDEFVKKLETRYKDTYNIMLHRDPTYTYLNYNLKNLDCIVEDDKNKHLYYTEEWNEVYKNLVINTNIIDMHFDELIKNPIRTITRVIQYTNIDKSIGNTKEIIKVYKHYCDKQRFLEPIERYWK